MSSVSTLDGVERMSSPPGPRPGDHDFEGFKMQLPENNVEYMLFIIDNLIEPHRLLHSLEALRKTAIHICESLTKDYIWQRDAFNLGVTTEKGLVYLHGITDYGDSVEDEWLVVYLLRELTKTFPNLWVRVFDSDGEFLLVEAANVLPKWLNPEIDSNRVWIHDSELRIIPVGLGIGPASKSISLEQAVNILESSPELLVHSSFVEAEAFYRLEKYPSQIVDSLHHSLATIPRRLAHILHARPKAIAPATEAFYLRDPPSLKPLLSSARTLVFPPEDLVTVSVRFTKVLFAQLVSQRFEPTPAWKGLFTPIDTEAPTTDEHAQKRLARLELGMKITAGFEMLMGKAQESGNRVIREVAVLVEDLEEDGHQVLPSDQDIKAWPEVGREDDDSWMNINYEDFERELDGGNKARDTAGASNAGFGDENTQADLRKIVSRFEAFLNDESAGIGGAEVDEMDEDDDSDDVDNSEDSEDEDKEVSFDEEQFSSLMREMMGLSSEAQAQGQHKGKGKAAVGISNNSQDEDEEIRQLALQMESELAGYGALTLDPKPKDLETQKGRKSVTQKKLSSNDMSDEGESDDRDEVDIDYNLAKNLLESFKGQAGVAGPAGNMLAMMGITLPRDEGDDDDGHD